MVLEYVSLGTVLLQWVIIVLQWDSIPDVVPVHFDIQGNVDDWGDKSTLFIMPAISVCLYGGLTLLARYPEVFNYPWPITQMNADLQYHIARKMIAVLKVEVLLLLGWVVWNSVNSATGSFEDLSPMVLPASVVVIAATAAIFIRQLSRNR